MLVYIIIAVSEAGCFSCGAGDVQKSRNFLGQVLVASGFLLPYLPTTACEQNMKGLNFM